MLDTTEQVTALSNAITGFKTRMDQTLAGHTVDYFTISAITGEMFVTYTDTTVENLGVVVKEPEDGEPGVGISNVELFVDEQDEHKVFLETTLTNGIKLKTQDPLNGWNGKSLSDVYLLEDHFHFVLTDGSELDPIYVGGVSPISIVGSRYDVDTNEMYLVMSDDSEIASGLLTDMRGTSVEDVQMVDSVISIKMSDNTEYQTLGQAVGIESIRLEDSELIVTTTDAPGVDNILGDLIAITGARIEGGEFIFSTNKTGVEYNLGPVADAKGDQGVGVQSVALVDNALNFTLTDSTVLDPIPVSGLTPISVSGARHDVDNNELILLLTNGSEINTGVVEDLRGASIINTFVDTDGKVYVFYSDAPATPVYVADMKALDNIMLDTDNNLMVTYNTDAANPINIGHVRQIENLYLDNNRLTASYSDSTTDDIGLFKTVASMEVLTSGILNVTYNDGSTLAAGTVIGPKGDQGVSITNATIDASGDLILARDQGENELNAGMVRTQMQNFLGSVRAWTTEVNQTDFVIEHDGVVLAFVDGLPVADTDLDLTDNTKVVFNTPLAGNLGVKIAAFSEVGASISTKGVNEVIDNDDGTYTIQLENNLEYTIDTNTPIDDSTLPPGITNVVVEPNGDLTVSLSDGSTINAGSSNNAINTTGVTILPNGDLQVTLSDNSTLVAGNVLQNLSITGATIDEFGHLIIQVNSTDEYDAGMTANYVTGATIDGDGLLQITLSDSTVLEAGQVVNPLIGQVWDFICFEGQYEFNVPHNGYKVLFNANGVALSPQSLDLSDPAKVKVVTPRMENDIVRIVLLTEGGTVAAEVDGVVMAPDNSYYGKDSNGNIGFHQYGVSKYAAPVDYIATQGQQNFSLYHNNSVDVIHNGKYLMPSEYSLPTKSLVRLVTPCNVNDEVRVTALTDPKAMGEFVHTNYARVQFRTYSQGGTFNSGGWKQRSLNTIAENGLNMQLANNRFILPSGKYYVTGWAACHQVRTNQVRIYNTTEAEVSLLGPALCAAKYTNYTAQSNNFLSPIQGYITLTTQSALLIQHKCMYGRPRNGFGAVGPGSPHNTKFQSDFGDAATLVDLEIWKVD